MTPNLTNASQPKENKECFAQGISAAGLNIEEGEASEAYCGLAYAMSLGQHIWIKVVCWKSELLFMHVVFRFLWTNLPIHHKFPPDWCKHFLFPRYIRCKNFTNIHLLPLNILDSQKATWLALKLHAHSVHCSMLTNFCKPDVLLSIPLTFILIRNGLLACLLITLILNNLPYYLSLVKGFPTQVAPFP